eukprot:8771059-Lingulodinium_polyedra.AAC.1
MPLMPPRLSCARTWAASQSASSAAMLPGVPPKAMRSVVRVARRAVSSLPLSGPAAGEPAAADR